MYWSRPYHEIISSHFAFYFQPAVNKNLGMRGKLTKILVLFIYKFRFIFGKNSGKSSQIFLQNKAIYLAFLIVKEFT